LPAVVVVKLKHHRLKPGGVIDMLVSANPYQSVTLPRPAHVND